VDTPAGGFFYAVYHFLAGEASDNGRTTRAPLAGAAISCAPTRPIPLRGCITRTTCAARWLY